MLTCLNKPDHCWKGGDTVISGWQAMCGADAGACRATVITLIMRLCLRATRSTTSITRASPASPFSHHQAAKMASAGPSRVLFFGAPREPWTEDEEELLWQAYIALPKNWALDSYEHDSMARDIRTWITQRHPTFQRGEHAIKVRLTTIISARGEHIERVSRAERVRSRERIARSHAREHEAKRKAEEAEAASVQTTKQARLLAEASNKKVKAANKKAEEANKLAARQRKMYLQAQEDAKEAAMQEKLLEIARLYKEAQALHEQLPAHRRSTWAALPMPGERAAGNHQIEEMVQEVAEEMAEEMVAEEMVTEETAEEMVVQEMAEEVAE